MNSTKDIISRFLGEPLKNIAHSICDEYVEANVKFRTRAGVKTLIIRRELSRCCDWCRNLAGIYDYSTAPREVYQRHDSCRCMVTFKNEEGKYTDVWSKKEYEIQRSARIERSIEITKKNDIINMKVNNKGEVLNPMNSEEYFKIKEVLGKQGIEVVSATEGDDLRYMLSLGAEATYSNNRITHIGEIPSRGTLMEEIIHMWQSHKYGELDSSDLVELYAREIEANRKLLKYKVAYKIHPSDIKDIEKNLDIWEKKFLKVVGTTYDDSNYRKKI